MSRPPRGIINAHRWMRRFKDERGPDALRHGADAALFGREGSACRPIPDSDRR
jgi:hypothetical protein